jgi:CRISPR/Cas system-associated endoribonuclease Cas2/gas vesicle protein
VRGALTETNRNHFMNAIIPITFLGGALIGGAVGFFLAPRGLESAPEAKERIAVLEKDLANKVDEVKKLSAAPKSYGGAVVDVSSPEFKEAHDKEMEMMKKRQAEKLRLKVDERLAALKAKLNLTDAQALKLRPILEKHMKGTNYISMAMEQGADGEKVSEADLLTKMLNPGTSDQAMDSEIAGLLEPSQQQSYSDFKKEQRTNKVEITANRELARMQNSLTLSPEQKDKAFEVLSRLANEEYDKPIPALVGLMAMQGDDATKHLGELGPELAEQIKGLDAQAKQRRQQRLDEMKQILTPEQYSMYEKQDNGLLVEELGDMMEGAMIMGVQTTEEAQAAPEQP